MRLVDTPLGSVPRLLPRAAEGIDPALLEAFRRAPGTDALIARLRTPGALAVTTGQQPGLFTGPLYTVYKALSAAVLAERLQAEWNRPVVPIFWLASDDHDYTEARGTTWIGDQGEAVTVTLSDLPRDAPLTPMYRQVMGSEIVDAHTAFASSFAASSDRDATIGWLTRHYQPGRTIGDAFGGALAELLAPFGVLCLESTHPAVKRVMAPVLLGALECAEEIEQDLVEAAGQRQRSGAAVSVPVGDRAALVFLETDAGRDRLVMDGGGFHSRRAGVRQTLPELRDLARSSPQRFSPNVLLRPVVESALLPTIAYVAGPGELDYFELCTPVYARLGIPRQPAVPRWSGVVVEPRVDRVLRKFSASLEDLLATGNALERKLVRSHLPGAVFEAFARLRAAIEAEYAILQAEAVAVDPTLARPFGSAQHNALAALREMEKKLEGHQQRREATELAQIGRARTAVLPGGKPQERVVGVAGYLAKYGPGFLHQVHERIRAWYDGALVVPGGPS